jgi:putative phage-type endonuclease
VSGLGVALALRQRSPEWLEARRSLITGTDIPVLLGISPWMCEADLADAKRTGEQVVPTLRMKIGSALEDLIASEYVAETGRRVRRSRGMVRHADIEWAAASLDATVIGERRAVELKHTSSRSRFADGIPQDVQAQVAWGLGCSGLPVADVAVLGPDRLDIFEQAADPALFADLVAVAQDFRRRLAEGGPFAESNDSLRRRYPADNGAEMVGDADLTAAVMALVALRGQRKALEGDEERLEAAIKSRMGEIASLVGPGYRVSWKRTKDSAQTDWKAVAGSLLTTLSETDRDTAVAPHTTVRPGFRPFRVVLDKEGTE